MQSLVIPSATDGVVRLRPLKAGDFESLRQAAADPAIWALHPNRNRHEDEAFALYFDNLLSSNLAVVAEATGEGKIIGASRYAGVPGTIELVEIGWSFLSRDFWGGEYNYRIKRLMINQTINTFQGVLFWIDPNNHRSRRATLKLGAIAMSITELQQYGNVEQKGTMQAFVLKSPLLPWGQTR